MEQGYYQLAAVPTLSALGHRSDASLNDIVKYAETLNRGTLCVTLEDEQGRFRIWASNLGALQPAESMKSLDERLKDAPLMRKSVVSGLERLEGSAKRALAILNKTAPNQSISGGDATPTTELDELLLSIRSAINHLFSLSMLIRRQRPRGRLPEVEEIALDSSPDISYLTDKYPKTKSNLWLARRLGNNITRQRRLIQYRQHHRQSLAKGDIKSSDPADATTIVATTFQEDSNAPGTNQTPQDAESSRMSVYTSATSFLSLDDETSTGRSVPDLLHMTLDGVQLEYGRPFECPYCRTIQNVGNRYEWKRHVFTDMQPYVCTFKDCAMGNKPFPTRAEWFQHECTIHRLQWGCNWCSQPDITFHSAEELEKHLNGRHSGMVTGAQMEMVLETCERPIKSFVSASCPLCADWEAPSMKENAKNFSRHLARHLQQLVLEALPLSIDGLDIRDANGVSDEESSLSHGSSNEEAARNQLGNPPTATTQGEGAEVDTGQERFKSTSDKPLPVGYREALRELVSGYVREAFGEPDVSQTEERRRTLSTIVIDSLPEDEKRRLLQAATKEDYMLLKNQEEKKKGIECAVAANVAGKREAEEPGERIEEDTQTRHGDSKKQEEEAILKFKDAVGREFRFPFHLCATWQGMEELIKQAFLHVDLISPHVMEGLYDLTGPDGELILPSVWENVIQPDMSITMTMWPMNDIPPPPSPGPYRTAGTSLGKKPVRRSGKNSESSKPGFLFGKPEKKKEQAVPSRSAGQQSQE